MRESLLLMTAIRDTRDLPRQVAYRFKYIILGSTKLILQQCLIRASWPDCKQPRGTRPIIVNLLL